MMRQWLLKRQFLHADGQRKVSSLQILDERVQPDEERLPLCCSLEAESCWLALRPPELPVSSGLPQSGRWC